MRELVYKLYDQAIDLTIETSGYFNFDDMKDILEKLNLMFIDIKHMDDNKHKFYTGISNEQILTNISKLNELKVPVVVRIPVIDGVNSDIENIKKTAQFVKANIETPSPVYLSELCKIVENEGVEVVSYK